MARLASALETASPRRRSSASSRRGGVSVELLSECPVEVLQELETRLVPRSLRVLEVRGGGFEVAFPALGVGHDPIKTDAG